MQQGAANGELRNNMPARTINETIDFVLCNECSFGEAVLTIEDYSVWLSPMAEMPGESVRGSRWHMRCPHCGFEDADDSGI